MDHPKMDQNGPKMGPDPGPKWGAKMDPFRGTPQKRLKTINLIKSIKLTNWPDRPNFGPQIVGFWDPESIETT